MSPMNVAYVPTTDFVIVVAYFAVRKFCLLFLYGGMAAIDPDLMCA